MDDLDLLLVDFLLGDGDLEVLLGDVLCFERAFFVSAKSERWLAYELRLDLL